MIKTENYSDSLIIEAGTDASLPSRSYKQKGVEVRETVLDKVSARQTGRKEGCYFTICPTPGAPRETVSSVLCNCLKKLMRSVGVNGGKILAVGLGNENAIVDALGNEVVKRIRTGGKTYVMSAIAPKVADITGIKSFDIVKAIVDYHKPALVIAIDTLSTNYLHRLGNCYQLSSAGICPGGGVGNPQPCLDKNTLGVPVIAVGVPLIISVGSIVDDKTKAQGYSQYMLTPRDVDSLVSTCADTIADAVNAIDY